MNDADTWMPLFIGKYLAKTGHLTRAQHGSYLLMIMHYWCNGPLPADDDSLASIARVDLPTWRRGDKAKLLAFFKLGGDGLFHQTKADKELEKTARISNVKSAAAQARWGSRNAQPDAKQDAQTMHPHMHMHSAEDDAHASADGYATEDASVMPRDRAGYPVPSPSKLDSKNGKEAARDLVPKVKPAAVAAVVRRTTRDIGAKRPPYTPSRAAQLGGLDESAVTCAAAKNQPQDPVRTVEEQLAALAETAA